jgi:hypothetical protein
MGCLALHNLYRSCSSGSRLDIAQLLSLAWQPFRISLIEIEYIESVLNPLPFFHSVHVKAYYLFCYVCRLAPAIYAKED